MTKHIVCNAIIAIVATIVLAVAVNVICNSVQEPEPTVTSSSVTDTKTVDRQPKVERQYIDDEYLNELAANTRTNKF